MFEFKLTDHGKSTLQKLALFLEHIGDMPPAAERKRLADGVRHGFWLNFEQQSAGGAPWAPLAPATVRDRQRHGYGGQRPKLIRTGDYMRSWTLPGGKNVEEWWQSGAGWNVVIGSTDRRVPWMELGTSHMPARRVSRLGINALRYLQAQIEGYYRRQEPKA